ncbi:unnamed protein product [Amaranthus hypochondriacus]
MIINGSSMNSRAYKPLSCNASLPRPVSLPAKAALTNIRALCRPIEGLKLRCFTGASLSSHLSASLSPLLGGEHGGLSHKIPNLPKRRLCMTPRAAKDVPYSFRFPPMTIKPRWWWRTLACLPYLMPLHETWMYAETAYNLHPFLEDLEFLTYPFLGAIGSLPAWFFMAYFFCAYLGIVRRKEWPHFFRFHVVMGMLLEIALQVVGTVSRWLPLSVYWGKVGMHFWTFAAFGYLFTVLECIRCALAGMYADVPFVCDAAYIQIPYD